ncbi:MAG: 1-(5-phosphoribosyl)-5-[(5-phosphoribosylamino)methylideneamino]imidazole-4-carboxamide isomerase [Leptospiraceae bacterium]|nr:1-(5-phosphoribosyl)-5-[(5-phosphoribosylamino)methylideneamino]imidazole-4-carboxamide isomerase [Leptospiraceae bacterium]MCB1317618.1 1-(5-phosphoribosyl)-5-[(5-phosphoribosylamino)methylideneamino]imidazole-4-carboxamide isomerase [Leptospiraceae bacterium]MCB1320099.1 1-(5-phosphoribosyl)-5-[(5-phosphoribosylamino)methylideneamino]imidazole-4-carboxamide isomerase [Leptospiraceae bacterium]
MQFIPAIDLLDGRVVRLHQGRYADSTDYFDDAAIPARTFLEAGAGLLHVVDLNAARNGDRSVNSDVIERIRSTVGNGMRIEMGGGIRHLEALQICFDNLGLDRCIIGTAAVRDPDFVSQAIDKYGPERVIIGIDALDGVVRISGWEESGGVDAVEFAREMYARGVREIIFTDIARDGALTGPALDSLTAMLDGTRLNVIASGGIARLEDVRALVALNHPRLVGMISGRAIYEGHLDVSQAVDVCARNNAGRK